MTWTKLSDDFSDDCWQLSDAAFRLHVEGLLWSNRKLLDLRLTKDEVRRWAKHPDAVAELLDLGWWRDDGAAYVIVHHGVYQRAASEVMAQQARNRVNGQKGGRPKGPPREQSPRKRANRTQSQTHMGSEAGVLETQSQTHMGSEFDAKNPVANSENNPVANPVANPQGQDRTGQAFKKGPHEKSEAAEVQHQLCSTCREKAAQGEPHPFPELCSICLEAQKHPAMNGNPVWHGGGSNPYEEYR